jgi:hypothetical protein
MTGWLSLKSAVLQYCARPSEMNIFSSSLNTYEM